MSSGNRMVDFLKRHFLFFAIVFLTVMFAYPYMIGIMPFDPAEYCKCAVDLLRGELSFNNFYCNRLGIYLPIALAIKLFGFNGYYLSLVTVVELVFLVAIVYLMLFKYNKEIALVSCVAIGFSPLVLELSGSLLGDIMAALTANVCILLAWHVRFISKDLSKQIPKGILLALLWYLALITKELAIYFLVPLLIVFIEDKRKKQFLNFWNAAIIAGIMIGALLLTIYLLETDDIFTRLRLLEKGPNLQYIVSWQVLLARITVLPVKLMVENISYFVIFCVCLIQLSNKPDNAQERFFKIYFVSLAALWWIGTQSFSSWKPVLLVDRLWLPLLVPMAINAAHVFYSLKSGNRARYATERSKIILALMAVAVLMTGFFNEKAGAESFHSLAFAIPRMVIITLLVLTIFHESVIKSSMEMIKQNSTVILLLLLPLSAYNFMTLYWKNPKDNDYLSELQMIDDIRLTQREATVISDRSVFNTPGIYYGFDPKAEQYLHFADWNQVDSIRLEELASQQDIYLLVSKDRLSRYKSYSSEEIGSFIPDSYNVPSFVLAPGPEWGLIRENSRTVLYKYKR